MTKENFLKKIIKETKKLISTLEKPKNCYRCDFCEKTNIANWHCVLSDKTIGRWGKFDEAEHLYKYCPIKDNKTKGLK